MKVKLLGFGKQTIIEALTKVEQVGEDAVGKFDVGRKLKLVENMMRGPLKAYQGERAEVTSWEGGLMTVKFESGEYTFDDKEKQIRHFKFFSMVQEDNTADKDKVPAGSRATSSGEPAQKVPKTDVPRA